MIHVFEITCVMVEILFFLFLVIQTLICPGTNGDPTVTCVFRQSCILPCNVDPSSDTVIHWDHLTSGEHNVHSYYDGEDQLEWQDQKFKGRTSLFRDLISRGNASLQLTGVKIQDEGRYSCYSSTERGSKKTFIQLKVEAIIIEVIIKQIGKRIICSSEDIYPKPELTWFIYPPSEVELHNRTTVHKTEEQLYSISSSLLVSGSFKEQIYTCTVSSGRNRKRVYFIKRNPTVTCVFRQSCILPCNVDPSSDTVIHWDHLTSGEHNVHSYYTGQDQLGRQNQQFKGRTSLFKDLISRGNVSLQLTGVKIQDEGRYSCYSSTERGSKKTFIQLKVEALITEVIIKEEGNRIICSSEGIYPKPELTWFIYPPSNRWSVSPPSELELHRPTTVHQTEEQLYNISSSLLASGSLYTYSCTVRSGRNRKTVSFLDGKKVMDFNIALAIILGLSPIWILIFGLIGELYCSVITKRRRKTAAHQQ